MDHSELILLKLKIDKNSDTLIFKYPFIIDMSDAIEILLSNERFFPLIDSWVRSNIEVIEYINNQGKDFL